MKREGKATLKRVLASAGKLLLRGRIPATSPQDQRREVAGAPSAEPRRVRFQALIERTRTEPVVERLRIKLGFPREVFERAVSPLIEGYAEFVQLLPAPGSASWNPDDLFARGLDVANRALDYRRGQILPRGAAPEVIGAQAHRWTYAVFVCALLSGAGNNGSDRTEEHAAQLLERFVPPSVLDWLAEDPTLMRELLAFLSDADSVQGGAIAELVFRATEFGSRDLLPRSRGHPAAQEFSLRKTPQDTKADAGAATITANQSTLPNEHPEYLEDVEEDDQAADRTVPRPETLVEQVPEAARRFIGWLQQGLSDGALPVNQAGALVHFVDEGMLLVSPRIFREFAKHCGRGFVAIPDNAPGEPDIGKSIQRQVLRAGWHLRADKGVNILTYQVMRRNRPASRLSGVVFPNPERFVDPVPPVNPLLVRLREERGDT